MVKILCSICLSFLLMSSLASAQVVIEMSTSTQDAPNRMYIKNDMTRADSKAGGSDMSTIFRGEEMVMVNHDTRTYQIFGRAEVLALADKMSEARKQMEEQMANIPPEQRAMVERMMGNRMAMMGSASAPVRVERGGQWSGR